MKRLPADFASRGVIAHRPEPRREDLGQRGVAREDDYLRREPFYHRREPAEGWSGTRLGVTMVYSATVLLLVGSGLQLLLFLVTRSGGFRLLGLLVLAWLGLFLVAGLLALVGLIMFCTIPEQSGARGWAVASLACALASIAAVVFLRVFAAARIMSLEHVVGVALLGVVGILLLVFLSSLFFTLVLRATARYWGDRDLGDAFVTYFGVAWVGLVAVVLFLFLCGGAFAGPVADCGTMVFSLAMLIWYLVLLNRLRGRIPVR
jgi:hypothetical protein